MARFLRRKSEFHELEAELRAARAEPPEGLVRSIASAAGPGSARRYSLAPRLGLAALLTVAVFAVFAGVGGLSRTAEAAKSVVASVQHTVSPSAIHTVPTSKDGPSVDEYSEKVTFCHREHQGEKGQTLSLPPNGAANHLKHHQYDTLGPC